MKLHLSFLVLCLVSLGICPGRLDSFSISVPTGTGEVRVTSEYRRLCQGEIVKITLVSPEAVSAYLSFDGKTFPFASDRKGMRLFTLIALPIDREPGECDAVIHLEPESGSPRDIPFTLAVSRGTFPSKQLRVARRFTSQSPEDIKRIRDEKMLLDRIYRTYAPGWLGDGGFVVPLKGKITGVFGERRVFNNDVVSRHRGIDISSRRGAPVRACNRGKVVLAGALFFAGNTVIIHHGIGLFSIYGHLSETIAREGAIIDKGEILGYVGSTGRSTGPHLHWGVRLVDEYVDPLSVMHLSFD